MQTCLTWVTAVQSIQHETNRHVRLPGAHCISAPHATCNVQDISPMQTLLSLTACLSCKVQLKRLVCFRCCMWCSLSCAGSRSTQYTVLIQVSALPIKSGTSHLIRDSHVLPCGSLSRSRRALECPGKRQSLQPAVAVKPNIATTKSRRLQQWLSVCIYSRGTLQKACRAAN